MIINTRVLITRIKDSEAMEDLRIFYRDEPWACTFAFSALAVFVGFASYLAYLVIYFTWPGSLYTALVALTVLGTVRQLLNWISKE